MRALLKTVKRTFIVLAILYIVLCSVVYFFQEALIFHPKKLDRDFAFQFQHSFTESLIPSAGDTIHGLLFRSDSSRGLVFYLHGNAGALDTWGKAYELYIDLGYDFFILDYPGYGKSSGNIYSEDQLHRGVQAAYETMMKDYREDQIIVIGYSIGTGPAARLASVQHPSRLILQAPYFNLGDMAHRTYPYLPSFLMKYTFATNEYLPKVTCPVTLFHGDADEIIPHESSTMLSSLFKKGDTLITLSGATHNGMNLRQDYREALASLLIQ
ncbi:MAG: alpha/beta hydrolase [Bacteroidia bacterium]|nr:alpha/beta hydrolase [Bacteroidia bacterium]